MLATPIFHHKLPSFNEPFASLDLANKVRIILFNPTADSGTMGFQGTARDSMECNLMPTPMLLVQQPVVQLLTSRQSSFTNEGRITPTFDDTVKKSGREGRGRRAMSYSTKEHTYLLCGMKIISDSFNASESSPEWKLLYKLMVDQYYNAYG